MSVLDFLFEGEAPPAVTSFGETTEGLPQWLSDYTQGLIAKANAIAAEPYVPYEGPRIAPFSQDQLSAFDRVRASLGQGQQLLNQGTTLTNKAAGLNPLASAQGYLDAASQKFPDNVDQYMNPYVQNVLDRQRTLANRTLNEDFLPSLQDAFTASGQFGSERMMEMGLRGARDIQEGLEEQRLATLGEAYGQAADIFSSDAGRAAQLAPVAGTLTAQQQEALLGAGKNLSAMGSDLSNLNLQDAASLEAIGGTQQAQTQQSLDTAYQDFLQQRDYPRTTLDWMSAMIRGIPYDTTTTSMSTGPSSVYQPSPLSQMASAYSLYEGLTQNKARGGLARARMMRRV